MPAAPSTYTSHSNFASIFNLALEKYNRKTKQDLAEHPLLPRFQSCDSSEAILTVLREQSLEFNQSQNTKWVTPTVNVLYSFSATLGGVVGLVNISIFPYDIFQSNIYLLGIPTSKHSLYGDWCSSPGPCLSLLFWSTCSNTLTQATKDVRTSRDNLIELFNRIERFFQRLEIYIGIPPTTAMRDTIVDIVVEVLSILGITMKEMKRGRLSESMLCFLPTSSNTFLRRGVK